MLILHALGSLSILRLIVAFLSVYYSMSHFPLYNHVGVLHVLLLAGLDRFILLYYLLYNSNHDYIQARDILIPTLLYQSQQSDIPRIRMHSIKSFRCTYINKCINKCIVAPVRDSLYLS